MVTSLFLKNYKAYSNINFIPVTYDEKFSVYFGTNGVGKSSVLEALDTFFNERDWNINKYAQSRGGFGYVNLPHIVPVFLLEKSKLPGGTQDQREQASRLEKLSGFFWNITRKEISSSSSEISDFFDFRDRLRTKYDPEAWLFFLAGIRYEENTKVFFGPFHHQKAFLALNGITRGTDETADYHQAEDDEIQAKYGGLVAYVSGLYSFIYIPSDIDVENYTKLENADMQKLMHKDVQDEIRRAITTSKLSDINKSLQAFVDGISMKLEDYTYRKKSGGKSNITMPDLISKIVETYFSIRVLSKNINENFIPVSQLSSGEKRKALVDVAYAFLNEESKHEREIILAIDEPEVSLHVSACYEQFEKLKSISRFGHQVIITTHWYGFLPVTSSGYAHNTYVDSNLEINFSTYSLEKYREEIVTTNRRESGLLPFDVYLKSTNDLVQSILSSMRTKKPYNYLLCEGTSDQIYLRAYLAKKTEEINLRILPLGGCGEIVRILKSIVVALDDKNTEIGGKVVGLIDTDMQESRIKDLKETKSVMLKRILFTGDRVVLVPYDNSTVSPETQIEDALNPSIFVETIRGYGDSNANKIFAEEHILKESESSYNVVDYRDTERRYVREFFSSVGRKVEFAKIYVSNLSRTESTPSVFLEIEDLYTTSHESKKSVVVVKRKSTTQPST